MAEQLETTHVLLEHKLIIYRRERSGIWQCRYKVDGKWQRTSTKEYDINEAKAKANELMIEAEIRKRENLPVVTRNFRSIAKLAIERMDKELASGVATRGLATYKDYKEVINDYLIACLGKRKITNIDFTALGELEAFRNERMQKIPSRSTMLTHNAALNRVFDEAEIRGYITKINRPSLVATGAKSIRRPAFDIIEVQALLGNFEAWIKRARTPKSRALRFVLSQYVNVLLDTGARPGKELLNLRWKQIKPSIKPEVKHTGQLDDEGEEIVSHNLNRSVVMTVSGKNGEREIVGMLRTVNALKEIGKRNYAVEMSVAYPLKNIAVASNDDLVFTIKNGVKPTSFNALFESYLEEHNLLVDPKTNQNRVLYSLRHTYATLALTHDKVPIHTLAKQMGTSVIMIEKHYSHLDVVKAIEQLRGNESRQLINAGGVIDAFYASKKAP